MSHPFVIKLREEILTGNVTSENQGRTYRTKHGTISTMNTANIGTQSDEPVQPEEQQEIEPEPIPEESIQPESPPDDDEDIEDEEPVYQPGQYAYCKYCYTKHNQWERGDDYDALGSVADVSGVSTGTGSVGSLTMPRALYA